MTLSDTIFLIVMFNLVGLGFTAFFLLYYRMLGLFSPTHDPLYLALDLINFNAFLIGFMGIVSILTIYVLLRFT